MASIIQLIKSHVILTLTIIIGICTLLLFSSYIIVRRSIITNTMHHIEYIKESLQSDINAYFKTELQQITNAFMRDHKLLKSLSNLIENQKNASEAKKQLIALLKQLDFDHYKDIIFVDSDQNIRFSMHDTISENTDLKQFKDDVLSILAQNVSIVMQQQFSDFDYSELSKEPTLYVGFPFINAGSFLGTLAVRINTNDLQNMINGYFSKLTQNEDILIAKTTGKKAVLIFNTKNNKNAAFSDSFPLAIENPTTMAIKGDSTTDIFKTIDNQKIINSKSFLIAPEWAIVIQHNLSKTLFNISPLLILAIFFLFVFIILSIISIFKYRFFITHISRRSKRQIAIEIITVLLIISSIFLMYFLREYKINNLINNKKIFAQTNLNVAETASLLLQDLYTVQSVTHSLQLDISSGKFSPEHLKNLVKKNIESHKQILGITIIEANTFNSQVFFKDIDKGVVKIDENITQSNQNVHWIKEAFKSKKELWINPFYYDLMNNKLVVLLCVPFYTKDNKQEPAGILATAYLYNDIEVIINLLGEEKLKHTMIFAKNGDLVYHYKKNYVIDQVNIGEIIRHEYPSLSMLLKEEILGISGYQSFKNHETGHTNWLFYDSLPVAGWEFVIWYDAEELSTATDITQHTWLLIILAALLFCSFAAMLITRIYDLTLQKIAYFSLMYSCLLITAIILVIHSSYQYAQSKYDPSIVSNKLELERLMHKRSMHGNKHQNIPLQTGIFVNFINANKPNAIEYTCLLWQRIENKYKDIITPGVLFENTSFSPGTIEDTKVYTDTKNQYQVHLWKKIGTLFQKHTPYRQYPFDIQYIDFILKPTITHNITLIPDLESYISLNPKNIPGLNPMLRDVLYVVRSYFSYKNTPLLLKNEESDTTEKNLRYTIVLKRNIFGIIIQYLLPLLIILITIFIILILIAYQKIDQFGLLTAYTGLLFSQILVHQSLRTALEVNVVTYIEYLFFVSYVIIILAYIDVIFVTIKEKFKQIKMILFWPFVLTFMFLLTFTSFYI